MTKNELHFAVFCIENVAEHLNLNGTAIYKMLTESKILDEYIISNYDVLHTQGKEYIVGDIVDIMQKEGLLDDR